MACLRRLSTTYDEHRRFSVENNKGGRQRLNYGRAILSAALDVTAYHATAENGEKRRASAK